MTRSRRAWVRRWAPCHDRAVTESAEPRHDATDPESDTDPGAGPGAGRVIVLADTVGTALFAGTAILEAVLLRRWTEVLGVAVALVLFALGCVAFLLGYARAIQRSRTEELSVAGLFLLAGPAVPSPVKRRLGLLLAAQITVALATALARSYTPLAFGILVPVFGVGLNGLWAARHGRFPGRATRPGGATPEDHHRGGEMEQNASHG